MQQKIDVTSYSGIYVNDRSALEPWLKEIRKYPVLDADEQLQLIKKFRETNDFTFRDKLVKCNQRFIYAVAKRYTGDASLILDLISEGNRGLLLAIDRFEFDHGCKFLSFAVWYIKCFISEAIVGKSIVKNLVGMANTTKFNKIKNNFFMKEGRWPLPEEIMDIFNNEYNDAQKKVVNEKYIYNVEMVSLDDTVNSDIDETFENSLIFTSKTSSHNDYLNTIDIDYNKKIVNTLLNVLPERNRLIMKMAFGIGYDKEFTNEEIGDYLGLSKERIRQIKNASIRKLKNPLKNISRKAI